MNKQKPLDALHQVKSVGIWIRVSTEDQAKGESPEHHERRARAYAESKGWKIREVYHLEGVSGKAILEHPETKKMIGHLREGRISALIFSKLARLARNTRELLDLSDLFRECGADLVSLQESIDTSTPAGRLFYTMIAAMAQWEREEIAERIAASIPIRAQLGKFTGGAAPYGFQWKDKRLQVDEKEAPVRRLLFELFAEHKRKKAVARILNERGYRTRSGANWSDTTVERLIRDTAAKGQRRANYTRSLGHKKHWTLKPKEDWVFSSVEPIVSEELWNQCNAILDARRSRPKRHGRPPTHLFTGLVHCHCGELMYVESAAKISPYVCRKCRNKIKPDDLEAVFQGQLKAFLLSPEDIAAAVGAADEEIMTKEERLAHLQAESSKLLAEMNGTHRLYLDGQITGEGFGRTYGPLEERFNQMEEELPRLQGEVDFLKVQFLARDEILSEAKDLYDRWESLSAEEKRTIIEAVVEVIRIGRDEVQIDLASFRPSSEVARKRQRFDIAVAPVVLACDVSPTSIDFGPVTLGQVVDRTFTLKNLSPSTMTGAVSSPSTVFTVPGATSYSLAPMQTATFIARFASDQPGPYSAAIQTGQPGCPSVTCTAVAQTVCAVSTDQLDFGLVAVGSLTKRSFTITNVGSAVLTGDVGTDGTCEAYSVEGAPVPFNLTPGQSITITVDFNPIIGEGVFTCTVLIIGNGISCPSITCSAVAQFPCNCQVMPTSFNFGDVVVGTSLSRQFSISTGGETAIGGVISVLGSGYGLSTTFNPRDVYTSLSYLVGANTSQTFNLVFQPQVLGATSAAIAISQTSCTRIGSPCDTLHCTGTGITTPPPPACAVSTTNLSIGTLHSGQSKDTTFTVTNTGGGTLAGAISWLGASYPFSLVGSASYSLAAGQSKSFTVRFVAPTVQPGHTESYAETINLGTPCAGLGYLTVQGVAIP